MNAAPPPSPLTSPSPRRWSAWRWVLLIVLGAALLTFVLVTGGAWWVWTTTTGLRAAALAVNTFVPGVAIAQVDGTLADGFRVGKLVLHFGATGVTIEDVAIQPKQWTPYSTRIDVERLSARRVAIDWESKPSSAPPPTSIGIPLDLTIRQGQIGELAIGPRDAAPTVFRRLEFTGSANENVFDVSSLSAEIDRITARGRARLGARSPFPLDAKLDLATTWSDRAIAASAVASGSLHEFEVGLQSDDSVTRARATATLRAFEPVYLGRLSVDVDTFDPSVWFADTPSMQLRAHADLKPLERAGPSLGVAGPFVVENRAPGTIDRDRVPLRSLEGTLTWSEDRLALAITRANATKGTASGELHWSSADGLSANVRFAGIDLADLHSRAVATRATGELAYTVRNGEQHFEGNARNTSGLPISAEIVASLRARVLEVSAARLRLGEGLADLRGRLELDGAQSVQLAGRFTALDLAQVVRSVDTRLNGTLEARGHLRSPLGGELTFALTDSRLAGRALTGRGRVTLADRRVDADIDVQSATARLTASGGLGAGRELRVELNAPDIEVLQPGYRGGLISNVTLSGDLEDWRVAGTFEGSDIVLPGSHRITRINASFAGGRAAKEPLAVKAELAGYISPAGPESSLESATLIGRGTTASAEFELNAATAAGQRARVLASGGFERGAWRGALNGAEAGAPLDLLMRTPAPLTVSFSEFALGPATFELRGTHFTAVEITRADARWRTVGTFTGLQPQVLDAQARAPRRVVRTGAGDRIPLTLAGRWQLEYVDAVTGIAVIERTDGDIYSGIDALSPIGVSDVGAALSVLDNRVTGNVYMRGRALGKIDAEIDAMIDPRMTGGRLLAQDRPFRVVVDATLPDLSWIGPLIGDNVQFNGSGSIKATIGGTPADPTSTGTLRGQALRLAWVDQGVRMENGNLDAVLEDGVLVINELVFAGTPRVSPKDKRALEALATNRPFEVRAVGRIALRSLTGSIGVRATQLPVLQRADRWMVVSGTGGITLTPQAAELYAKVTADSAYIDFDAQRAGRRLPNDVTVVRPGEQRKAAETPPLVVTLNLQCNLGDRFYIEGAGLEARLAGEVSITGRTSQLRAEGSVRTVDGVYAGYGQRLQIERGIVTFQGPLDNPALNVLAIRSGLPVEVGVAIGGTALRPLVRLHSDPSMSDTEKLNWLVLGRPPGAGDGNDRALLSAAASALFSGQTDRASAGLMRSLGIDQITLQPGQSSASLLPRETTAGRLRTSGLSTSTAASDFVAVGKRISDDLYLSFEQALTGAEYFVALNYRLTRQLSLIARAGSTNSLDLVYSLAFD